MVHYGAHALQTERFRIRPLGLRSPRVRSLWHQIPGDQQDRPLEHSAQPTVEERMLKTISQNIQVTPELRNAEKNKTQSDQFLKLKNKIKSHNRAIMKGTRQTVISLSIYGSRGGYGPLAKAACDFPPQRPYTKKEENT